MNNFDDIIRNRDIDRDIIVAPPPNDTVPAGMALPQVDVNSIKASEFDKKMSEMMQQRDKEEIQLKNVIINQKIINKPLLNNEWMIYRNGRVMLRYLIEFTC